MINSISTAQAPEIKKEKHAIRGKIALLSLIIFLIFSILVGLLNGASNVSFINLIHAILTQDSSVSSKTHDYLVLIDIRLPRIILGLLVGSALAVSGVLMQGIFRNPLADPGIVGVSAGASLGAVLAIVVGVTFPPLFPPFLESYKVIISAFLGGLLSTITLYAIATRHNCTSIATMLLAGIALSALNSAIVGALIFIANDQQLRDITFWNLGSLAGATWLKVGFIIPFVGIGLFFSPFLSRALNALSLGEAAASHIGFHIQKVKNISIILVALMCGGAVAVSGGISFIGIIVPHILRLLIGPDHRYLIPCSILLGAALLISADTFARFIIAPAELPIGIVTALFGAPFFLWILIYQRGINVL
ncbi:FecCD family ABC transporter permease [Bartonella schoenbuchensis]|uniref:Hemin ABC transporter, permease protein n=2 Tax=Bartonella schoenbuchensis TaxID=165694 RepID=E6YYA9_BARSR|nr:iron ABC transporter permease [Bartonella schoenbuchensis]AQX30389.1 iron complex transport system permease protein [Bartonella schoenbuchensis R1]CBI81920.1 hemin ABC transporter, permease protein [Bartonella schoenbuchensis R1]CDP79871.1 hemin ABC transporter, permease protein [Bartonella schoenbuchensis]